MDNLSMPETCVQNLIKSLNKVRIQGITRTGDREMPEYVLQTKLQNS